ncbi:MAG: Gfo/Idh/MocA family protein, partial [Opitutales bacterium]
MNHSNNLRIACIGFGNMGWQHFCALHKHPDWEVAAMCDLDPARLEKPGQACPGARRTDDFQSILDDPSIDAVSINTLSNVRPGLVLRALEAGKHVQAEKPIAETPDKAFELAEKVRA